MSRREPEPGTSLLVRNISRSVRAEELRYAAEKYGQVRDVYIPKDYYTGESRGIGFVEFADPLDAEDGIRGLDRMVLEGKEISVVAARQGRKRPDDFRRGSGNYSGGYGDRDRGRDRGGYDRGGYERGAMTGAVIGGVADMTVTMTEGSAGLTETRGTPATKVEGAAGGNTAGLPEDAPTRAAHLAAPGRSAAGAVREATMTLHRELDPLQARRSLFSERCRAQDQELGLDEGPVPMLVPGSMLSLSTGEPIRWPVETGLTSREQCTCMLIIHADTCPCNFIMVWRLCCLRAATHCRLMQAYHEG